MPLSAATTRAAAAILTALQAFTGGCARNVIEEALAVLAAFALETSAAGAIATIAATNLAAAVRNAVGDAVEDSGVGYEAADLAGIGTINGHNLT